MVIKFLVHDRTQTYGLYGNLAAAATLADFIGACVEEIEVLEKGED